MTYSYQWLRCDSSGSNCASISGASGRSYKLGSSDVGARMKVKVTATNAAGTSSAVSAPTAPVASAPPSNTLPPRVSGTAVAGQTLSASSGSWTGTAPISYAYQWLRCDSSGSNCASISGATAQSYTLGSSDVGRTLRAKVMAINSAGTASAQSTQTSVVSNTTSSTSSIMVAETSSEESGGSKAAWITDLLGTQLPVNFPKIKALIWFNWRCYDPGLRYYWPFEIESSSAAQTAFATRIASSYYVPGGTFGSLPLRSKIKPPS